MKPLECAIDRLQSFRYTECVVTTITINQELGIDRHSFGSLLELLSYLEENGLVVTLHELPEDEVTHDMRDRAEEAARQYRNDPSSFKRL